MENLTFESPLSPLKVKENFIGFDFFNGLMEGLNEASAHSKGKAAVNTVSHQKPYPDIHAAESEGTLNMARRNSASLGFPRTAESRKFGKGSSLTAKSCCT